MLDLLRDLASLHNLMCSEVDGSTETSNFNNDPKDFVSARFFDQLQEDRIIDRVLSMDASMQNAGTAVTHTMKQRVQKDAVRVFAIGLYSQIPLSSLMTILLTTDLCDGNLPFKSSQRPGAVPQNDFDLFLSQQNRFTAPYFQEGVFSQEIVASRPLTITYSVSDRLGSGKTASGKVYKAELFANEHNFQHKLTSIALKVIPEADDARRERNVLTYLVQNGQARLHPHIARFYGGFQFKNATYLMAELADCDLEHFMERTPTSPSPAYLDAVWLKRQFRGLAQALHAVHTKHPDRSITHHDIKPANILVQKSPDTDEHTLKITDWGCAAAKLLPSLPATGSPTNSRLAGAPYLPPECRPHGDEQQPSLRGRAYLIHQGVGRAPGFPQCAR
jgi:serine/threonine protein kinase